MNYYYSRISNVKLIVFLPSELLTFFDKVVLKLLFKIEAKSLIAVFENFSKIIEKLWGTER